MTAINGLAPDYDPRQHIAQLDDYQRIAGGTAIYPGHGTPLGLAYCALKLNGEAGELAEHVGKAMRDDMLMELGELTPGRRNLILKECGDVLWYIARIAAEEGFTLSDVANENLRKLYDRMTRGVLQGSGDTR